MQQYIIKKVVPKVMRYKKNLHHLSEFKDSDFETLSHCDIKQRIFLEAESNYTSLINKSVYCFITLCHSKCHDTKTLSKRHAVDLK